MTTDQTGMLADDPQRARLVRATGLLCLAFLWVTTARTHVWADARQVCHAAESLLDHGRPDLPSLERGDVLVGPDGRYYTRFPLVIVLGCTPWVAVNGALGGEGVDVGLQALVRGFAPAALGATSIVGALRLALVMGATTSGALITAVALMGTPAWVYARTYNAENVLMCLMTWLVLAWTLARRTGSRRWFWLAVVCTGLLPHAKLVLAALMPLCLLYYGWGRFRQTWPDLWRAGLALLPFVAVMAWYHAIRTGNLSATGYSAGPEAQLWFDTPPWLGAYGLLLSSGKGVFFYAPFVLLAASGLRVLAARDRALAVLLGAVVGWVFISSAMWWGWSGGWAWGPRFLVPLLPVLCAVSGLSPRVASSPRACWALVAAGYLVQLGGVLVNATDYLELLYRHVPMMGKHGEHMLNAEAPANFFPALSPIIGHWWLAVLMLAGPIFSPEFPACRLGMCHIRVPDDIAFFLPDVWPAASAPSMVALLLLGAVVAAAALRLRRLERTDPPSQ